MTTFIQTFDSFYAPRLRGRAATFRAVIREAQFRQVKHIVETGCLRQLDNYEGDGQSTLIWSEYVKETPNGSLVSYDIDEDAITNVAALIAPSKIAYTALAGDSILSLHHHNRPIDLLYLDSMDVDMGAPHISAMHALMEFAAARPRLHSGSIVFVDDAPMEFDGRIVGKGLYVAEYFKKLNVMPFTIGYQSAWIMP